MINVDRIPMLNKNKVTLKEASRDNHNGKDVFMTESSITVYDFDAVKDDYVRTLNISNAPKSNDALFFGGDGEIFFIEFKNGHINKEIRSDIKMKIVDSLLIFTDIIGEGISFTREHLNYILVYNEEKNPADRSRYESDYGIRYSPSRTDIGKNLMELRAKKSFVRFGLERFKTLYFKNVYTYSKKEFDDYFVTMKGV